MKKKIGQKGKNIKNETKGEKKKEKQGIKSTKSVHHCWAPRHGGAAGLGSNGAPSSVESPWGTQSCGDPMTPSCPTTHSPAGCTFAGQRMALTNSVTSGGRRTLSEGLDLKTTNDGEPATSLGKLLRWLITLPV